jgi:hypothetical protein
MRKSEENNRKSFLSFKDQLLSEEKLRKFIKQQLKEKKHYILREATKRRKDN